ncbi:MAG: GIY-YIG nuclease family protein [Candidatus Saccharimonadales bacterium]
MTVEAVGGSSQYVWQLELISIKITVQILLAIALLLVIFFCITMTSKTNKQWQLYVLRLGDGKFYVGITSKSPAVRMQEHLNGVRAAYWTAKHKPLEIIYQENLGVIEKYKAEKRENKMVRALMKQRGLNNVRGGDLTSVEEYIKRFGYVWDRDVWYAMTVVIFLMLVNVYLMFDKYFL